MTSIPPEVPQTAPVRVLLADDHPLFRRGVVQVLEGDPACVVVGEASDGLEVVEKARQLRPQVVLMDLNMPRCGGLEATLRLQAEMPDVKVLILTVSEKEEDLLNAVRFGARGFLLKEAKPREIINAVSRVAAGEAVFLPSMAAKLLEEFKRLDSARPLAPDGATPLSGREVEVLRLLATGASNSEIAATLFISENTVRSHIKNILEKLHVRNRSQAAAYAARMGIAK